jgi:hypothetical protein
MARETHTLGLLGLSCADYAPPKRLSVINTFYILKT